MYIWVTAKPWETPQKKILVVQIVVLGLCLRRSGVCINYWGSMSSAPAPLSLPPWTKHLAQHNIQWVQLDNLLDPRWSRTVLPPGLDIYIRPPVTLTSDLLTPELTFSYPCLAERLRQFASKSIPSFLKYRVHKFGNRQNRRTDGQTDGSVEYIRSPTSLHWRRHA